MSCTYFACSCAALTLKQSNSGEFVVVDPKRKAKVAVNRDFFLRLKVRRRLGKPFALTRFAIQSSQSLLKIVLPSWKSKQFLILTLHTTFLVSRTLLSIYVAKCAKHDAVFIYCRCCAFRLDGQIVKSIVDKQPKNFLWLLGLR